MSVITRMVLTTDTNGVDPTRMSNNLDSPLVIRQCSDLLGRAAQGGCAASLALSHKPVSAQAVVTFGSAGSANDTITIANVVITLVASGATGNQINIGASATATGANLATFVNAGGNGGNLTGICTASASTGVVTLTAAIPGTIGNGLGLAKTSTAITLTNLWGAVVAGSEGTATTFGMGL